MEKSVRPGVVFIGAGPGDPELITIKAVRYLRQAEVIISDRLANENIVAEYAPEGAEKIVVGKQGGKRQSSPQEKINELLVHYALLGKRVVRLKGGDVSIFSNIADELHALNTHNISYQLVPGITAALGAAASFAIPLTARGISSSVRFLTCHDPSTLDTFAWPSLAATSDTLVFYMSSNIAGAIVERLLTNHIDHDCYIAVIEQATTPFQRIICCKVHEYSVFHKDTRYISPSLVMIGKVVGLYRAVNAAATHGITASFFEDLPGDGRPNAHTALSSESKY